MYQLEENKLEELMCEAIRNAKRLHELLNESDRTENPVERTILLASANRYLGYANGINQALVVVGFKHERMKVLEDLLGF